MSDDPQMELESMAEYQPEEEETEASSSKSGTSRSSSSTKRKRRSTKSGSSGGSEEVKPETIKAAGPTVEAVAMMDVQTRVNVRSLWPARLVVRNSPSGEAYEWPHAGALVSVNSVDVEFLMAKNVAGKENACCGGGPRNYFELV